LGLKIKYQFLPFGNEGFKSLGNEVTSFVLISEHHAVIVDFKSTPVGLVTIF